MLRGGEIDDSPNNSTMNAYHVMFLDGTIAYGNVTNACIIDGFNIVNLVLEYSRSG